MGVRNWKNLRREWRVENPPIGYSITLTVIMLVVPA